MPDEYDVIVVGSGAGGSTVAREMTRRGWKVLILERGGRAPSLGNSLTVALVLDHCGLTLSQEKYPVTFASNFGGLSNLSAGCAAPPPQEIFDTVGVDLREEAEEARGDMWIQKLPDPLIGETNLRLLHAAHDAGYNWQRMDNFIDAKRCRPNCADCMLGCPTGAKFTARVYGDEALLNGARLGLHSTVQELLVENGTATGVSGTRFGRKFQYHARRVVLSAGADNARLLRKAGIPQAGQGFCCDFLQFAGAVIPGMNTFRANPMTVGTLEHYASDGILITPVFPNWAQFALLLWFTGWQTLVHIPEFWKYTGIMVKIRDDTSGEILNGGSFSKPLTRKDRSRLNKGLDIIKKIFVKAGARQDSFIALQPMGAHPSATCRIGHVVNSDLKTPLDHLYCCDASVFPESLGLPVVWTVVSLGKRLAKHLDAALRRQTRSEKGDVI